MILWSAARVASACILPIALLEAGAQHFGEVGLLGPLRTAALTETVGLHYPARCHRGRFGVLYVEQEEVAATMCTDASGTIEPTSLRALLENEAPAAADYIVACGGSTTEAAAIDPRERWVTRLSRRLDIAAINAGAASKGMAKCAQTLDFLLERIPRDRRPLILLATSASTLGTFLPARFAGWSGGAIPAHPHAPTAPHPRVRAWIPGLYHLAAAAASAMGSRPGQSHADALAEGCCHMAGAANRDPARRFDWQAEENRELYARFTAKSLDAIEAVIVRHRIARERVLFIVEPNSFGHDSMPHLARDFRQHLHGLDGGRLDSETSAALTRTFDDIYARVVGQRYTVIRADRFDLPPTAFYDAVRMTASGAQAFADHLEPTLRARLTGAP